MKACKGYRAKIESTEDGRSVYVVSKDNDPVAIFYHDAETQRASWEWLNEGKRRRVRGRYSAELGFYRAAHAMRDDKRGSRFDLWFFRFFYR